MLSPARWLIVAVFAACCALAHAATDTVLVIESYHKEFAWDASYRQAISDKLSPRYAVEFFEMNTKRLPAAEHQKMAAKALARIEQLRPALIILGDDAALSHLGTTIDKLGIPAVYLGINNNPRLYNEGRVFKHITGVLERPLIKRNIAFIRQIVPDARRILVLFDKDLTSTIIGSELFYGRKSVFIEGIEVVFQQHGTYFAWQTAVSEAKSDGFQAIFAGLYQSLKQDDGTIANPEAVITWSSQKTPVPLFGFWDFAIGPDKAIGGLVCSGKEQGEAAADIALRIIERGESVSSIVPRTAPQGHLVFSKKQLSRFALKLPTSLEKHAHWVE